MRSSSCPVQCRYAVFPSSCVDDSDIQDKMLLSYSRYAYTERSEIGSLLFFKSQHWYSRANIRLLSYDRSAVRRASRWCIVHSIIPCRARAEFGAANQQASCYVCITRVRAMHHAWLMALDGRSHPCVAARSVRPYSCVRILSGSTLPSIWHVTPAK